MASNNDIKVTMRLDTGGFQSSAASASQAIRNVADSAERVSNVANEARSSLSSTAGELNNVSQSCGKSSGAAEKAANAIQNAAERTEGAGDAVHELDTKTKDAGRSMEETKRNVNNTEKAMKSAGDTAGTFGSKLQSAAKVGAKAFAAVSAAAATTVGAAVKESVESFGDYEQLVGGVETLFGANGAQSVTEYAQSVGKSVSEVQGEYDKLMDAQQSVMNNARNAYETAGLSANEYMETVTGFSASLISSLGGDTQQAATLANQALVDMSDNANKMGTDMESIQNAYQGFAKQNYTMLDNLKLGYGGTKEEMERLLSDAEKLTGKKYDVSSFADITEAIHAIQTEMHITGTTANEAATTVQGSANMLKSAWKNALTAIGTGGDTFDDAMDNLVSSAKTFGDNIIPVVERALQGVGEFIKKISPTIAAELPGLINSFLPSLVSATGSLVSGLISQIPTIAQAALSAVPAIFDSVAEYVGESALGKLKDAFSGLSDSISNAFGGDGTSAISNLAGSVLPPLVTALTAVANVASFVVDNWNVLEPVLSGVLSGFMAFKAISKVQTAFGNANKVIGLAGKAIGALTSPVGIAALAIGALVAVGVAVYKNWDTIKNVASTVWNGIRDAISGAWEGIKSKTSEVWNGIKDTISGAWDGVKSKTSEVWDGVKSKTSEAWEGIKSNFAAVGEWFGEKWETVKTVTAEKLEQMKEAAAVGMDAAKETVSEKLNNIKTAYEEHGGGIKGVVFAAIEGVKGYYTAGYTLINNLTGGKLGEMLATVTSKVGAVKTQFINKFEEIRSGITNKIEAAKEAVRSAIDKIKSFFNFSWSLPKIKIPHFSISGSFNLAKLQVPKISVDWYANGGILTRPTIFGLNGNSLQAGGEKGAEAVVPLSQLWNKLGEFANKITSSAQGGEVRKTIENFIVNVNAEGKTVDEIVNELIPKVKLALANM